MAIGWTGDRVRLTPLDERHFENCYQWINDPEISEWLKGGDEPMAMLAEREWFDSVCKGSERNIMFAIETLDGEHIGNTGIHGINRKHGFATTGSLIGNKSFQNQGIGTEAAKLRAWYCFHVLGLRLVMSGYFGGNDRSARMQEKAGYIVRGVVPGQYWKRGAYRDHVETVLTRERWLEISAGKPVW